MFLLLVFLVQRADGAQFDISAFAARLELDARVVIVPFIADDGGIVAPDRVLQAEDRLGLALLFKRFALEHQIRGGRQRDHV